MTSHDEKSRKAKTTKGKLTMKKTNITFTTILLVLGCFALSPAVKAGDLSRAAADGPPIVGLWDVTYTSDNPNNPPHETYQQWHTDGLEIESPSFSLGQCQGTWKQISARGVQLFHVGFTVGDPPGTYRFVLTEPNTVVSTDRNSFDGTYDQKFYDADGNLLFEDTGTVHATRLSVDQPTTTASR
jgi:hypothetical protein